jgi:hypothetical protein
MVKASTRTALPSPKPKAWWMVLLEVSPCDGARHVLWAFTFVMSQELDILED